MGNTPKMEKVKGEILAIVRKKMSEAPRTLSNQTKAKIRASLTSLWGTRLKWKRSREKFLQLWAGSIATAAKKGGIDEQELDWDSYDKLKQEIALLQTEWTAEKAKIHKKKSAVNQVSSQHQRPWEKLDLEFANGLRQENSLADQIRFAKNRRSEQMLDQL
ncbi:hypothetical protein CASFOL_019206 [Castilleja foliolosa]|uniref:Uncharacterized protein n=1 Tax=Castilleja foliolosa TaxID=1961234 RepID=A0ABD3D5C6_9LAMI